MSAVITEKLTLGSIPDWLKIGAVIVATATATAYTQGQQMAGLVKQVEIMNSELVRLRTAFDATTNIVAASGARIDGLASRVAGLEERMAEHEREARKVAQ